MGAATGAVAGAGAERFEAMGSRLMWQIGHSPGSAETICGCIGQWYFAAACAAPPVPCICALAYDHHMKMARKAATPSSAQRTSAMILTPGGGGSSPSLIGW